MRPSSSGHLSSSSRSTGSLIQGHEKVVDTVWIPTKDEPDRVIDLMRAGNAAQDEQKRTGPPERTCRMCLAPVTSDTMATAMLTGMLVNELCALVVDDPDTEAPGGSSGPSAGCAYASARTVADEAGMA